MAEVYSRKLTQEQWRLEQRLARNYFLVEAAKKYPDYFCVTPDRTFYMVNVEGDVEKLGHLILAEGSTNRVHDDDRVWTGQIRLVICSSDDCDISSVPMIYHDEAEGIRAWKELHAISGLRMTADDEEWLDKRLEMLDADDEDDEGDED
jgi:hypothetical protein